MNTFTPGEKYFGLGYLTASAALMVWLCAKPSDRPWIFGMYSLSYFVVILLTLAVLIFVAFIWIRFKKKALFILAANLIGLILAGFAVEIGGQVYAWFHPSYRVLPFIPDPELGWRMIPDMEYPFTGTHWYGRDYSTRVKTNSLGFRDVERKFQKASDTFRIALIGDSMVAARQVEFAKTAGQLLEKRLNEELKALTKKKYEVLNFGTPGYGVDQMSLIWDRDVSRYAPDLVFIYLFEKNYIRTTSFVWCQRGFLGIDNPDGSIVKGCLAIRPTATFTNTISRLIEMDLFKSLDSLILENRISEYFQLLKKSPLKIFFPMEYQKFVEMQNIYIDKEFAGKRVISHERGSIVKDFFIRISRELTQIQKKHHAEERERQKENLIEFYRGAPGKTPPWRIVNHVNLGLIQSLGQKVNEDGSDFILVDAFKFHNDPVDSVQFTSSLLFELAANQQWGYVDLSYRLNRSKDNDIPVRWKYDAHLNETGNQIFADVLFDFLKKRIRVNQ